jgi:hypothetical protein
MAPDTGIALGSQSGKLPMNRQKLALLCGFSLAYGAFVACANKTGQPGFAAADDGGVGSSGQGGTSSSTSAASTTSGGASSTNGSGSGSSASTTGGGGGSSAASSGGGVEEESGAGEDSGSSGGNVEAGPSVDGGDAAAAGEAGRGGDAAAAGEAGRGGDAAGAAGDTGASGGAGGDGGSCTVAPGSEIGVFTDPVATTDIAPPNPPGITFKDTDGNLVDAHGGGIIKVCDTYYLHGEYFLSTTTNNDFNGFSMYSSQDLATWKNDGIILPQQPSGQLGPNRKGERPHIIQCPSTGEFVLYAHSADVTYEVDKEVVYATSPTVNDIYSFKGSLLNASGAIAAHSDMSALTDGNDAYVVTESGWVYTLASDCHSWLSAKQYPAVNGTTGGSEAPTVFRAGTTYYWIGSAKTGWQANDDFYSTAPAMTGPWTYQGDVAPAGKLAWMTQSTWVMPIAGSGGTVYLYWGDHWQGQNTGDPGQHNYLTTYVFQPLIFTGTLISMPTYQVSWKLDVGAGTWAPN